jgi:hypothetical protein
MEASLGTPAKLGLILFPFVVAAPMAFMFGYVALDEATLKALLAGYVTLGVILYYPLVRLAGKSIVFDQVDRLVDSCMRIKQGAYDTTAAPPARGATVDFPGLARQIYWLGHAVTCGSAASTTPGASGNRASADRIEHRLRRPHSTRLPVRACRPGRCFSGELRLVESARRGGRRPVFPGKKSGGVFFGVGDCTGHGVPGAFMTLIAKAALDRVRLDRFEAIGRSAGRSPSFHAPLAPVGRGSEVDDGMDMGLLYCDAAIPPGSSTPAPSPLWIERGGDVEEVGADRMGLGYAKTPTDAVFANNAVAFGPGDTALLFSDGLTDQVGGSRNLPLGKRPLRQWLNQTAGEPLDARRKTLVDLFETHKGRSTRRDDVIVMAVRPLPRKGVME